MRALLAFAARRVYSSSRKRFAPSAVM